MDVGFGVPGERYESLFRATEALYARLQNRALASDDVIDLGAVSHPDHSAMMSRLFADRELFATHFDAFKNTYDLFRVFGEGETVLDVGAHWGYSALAMRYHDCRARIVSIEAMPFNLGPLARLKKLAGGSYDYVHVAATDVPQRLVFYVPVVNGKLLSGLSSTGGTLVPVMARHIARRAEEFPPRREGAPDEVKFVVVEVPGLPLDDIVTALDEAARPVGAIKMDIEGHEAAALKGARRLITERRPILMIEGGMQPAVRAVMQEYGYIRAARVEGQLVVWNQHPVGSDEFWYHPDTTDTLRTRGLVP